MDKTSYLGLATKDEKDEDRDPIEKREKIIQQSPPERYKSLTNLI